jgi:hypothetical protein
MAIESCDSLDDDVDDLECGTKGSRDPTNNEELE